MKHIVQNLKFLHFCKSCPQVSQTKKKDGLSKGSAAALIAPREHVMISSIAIAGNHE